GGGDAEVGAVQRQSLRTVEARPDGFAVAPARLAGAEHAPPLAVEAALHDAVMARVGNVESLRGRVRQHLAGEEKGTIRFLLLLGGEGARATVQEVLGVALLGPGGAGGVEESEVELA